MAQPVRPIQKGSAQAWRVDAREEGEGSEHGGVECGGQPEGVLATDGGGDGVEAGLSIEVFVLQGVEDVEAGDPEENYCAEEEGRGGEIAAHCGPGTDGGSREGEAKNQVGESR